MADEISRTLGKFVCTMCGGRRAKYVNALWFNKLTVKQNRKNKCVDLSALALYQATLQLHILCVHRVTYLMKISSVAQIEEPPLPDCGWDHEGRSFGLRKRILVLSRSCCLTTIMLMKVTNGKLTSISEITVWMANMIEIPVKFVLLFYLDHYYSCLTS